MAFSNAANYSDAAGSARAGNWSPADNFSFENALLNTQFEHGGTSSPYLLSPNPERYYEYHDDNDDNDILSGFSNNDNLFGQDTDIPLENHTMFPQQGGHETGMGFGYHDTNESFPDLQPGFGVSTISDRLFRQSNASPPPTFLQQTHQAENITPKVLDLQHAHFRTAPGQDLTREVGDLFSKIELEGYNIQETCAERYMDGIEALKQGLTAVRKRLGQRGLSPQEVQNLVVIGAPFDPRTQSGHLAQHLTPEHLQTALNRYGTQQNEHYKLGIVRSTSYTLNFEISTLDSAPPRSVLNMTPIIVWVYQEMIDYNTSRWCAIAPSNNPTQNYAQALQSPKPKAAEPVELVNRHFLHPGRRSFGSSQTGTQSVSSSSSAPVRCCGQIWSTRKDYRTHLKSHTHASDDRPFKCDECSRGFLWQKDLIRHMTKHNGKRDASCPVEGCDKSYTRRDNMVRHHDSAHPEMPPLSQKSSNGSGMRY